jgi:predicted lipoprotein
VAEDVSTLLDCFKIDHTQPSWPVNRWISGMIRLFKPQIVALLQARDRAVAAWVEEHPDGDVYEDRELEVTSYVTVSVEDQVRAVARGLMQRI